MKTNFLKCTGICLSLFLCAEQEIHSSPYEILQNIGVTTAAIGEGLLEGGTAVIKNAAGWTAAAATQLTNLAQGAYSTLSPIASSVWQKIPLKWATIPLASVCLLWKLAQSEARHNLLLDEENFSSYFMFPLGLNIKLAKRYKISHLPALTGKPLLDLFKKQLDNGATALLTAIAFGNISCLEWLKDMDVDTCEYLLTKQYMNGWNGVSLARYTGNTKIENIIRYYLPFMSDKEYESMISPGTRGTFTELLQKINTAETASKEENHQNALNLVHHHSKKGNLNFFEGLSYFRDEQFLEKVFSFLEENLTKKEMYDEIIDQGAVMAAVSFNNLCLVKKYLDPIKNDTNALKILLTKASRSGWNAVSVAREMRSVMNTEMECLLKSYLKLSDKEYEKQINFPTKNILDDHPSTHETIQEIIKPAIEDLTDSFLPVVSDEEYEQMEKPCGNKMDPFLKSSIIEWANMPWPAMNFGFI